MASKYRVDLKIVGFSLVELLVVLAITGILFSTIIPAYKHQVAKVRLSDGQSLLLKIQSQLERYRFDHHEYPKSLAQLRIYQKREVESEGGYYEVSLSEGTSDCDYKTCYVLKAESLNDQVTEVELELHSSGEKVGPW